MRPSVVGDALPVPSRKHSFTNPEVTTPTPLLGNAAVTTFFMASESMLDSSGSTAVDPGTESNFGIRSLESTVDGIGSDAADNVQSHIPGRKNTGKRRLHRRNQHDRLEYSSERSEHASASNSPSGSPPPRQERGHFPDVAPQVLTPVSYASTAPGSSLPSSPKSTSTRSLRLSDEDSLEDASSQAIVSSGDEDVEAESDHQNTSPQLIMPSIMMPSRRPFTNRGKSLGRLKVLVAGASGIGKTSLIRSIVQLCDDIVHFDPFSQNMPLLESPASRKPKTHSKSVKFNPTNHIVELYASTKAYPPWWSDFEETSILRKRKSGGEIVLERNICFVDTPGYDSGTSMLEGMDSVHQYIEAQMARNTSFCNMADGDLLSMLGGDGGFQVDLVLYLIMEHLKPTDIEFMSRLSQTTNVVPLLAKADTLSDSDTQVLKSAVSKELADAGIRTFVFSCEQPTAIPPYTICSLQSNDDDNMDASLLMSPDYIQPLVPSELSLLVEHIFDKDHASWLRHSAAKKIIGWRRTPRAMSIITPTSRISFTPQYNRANASPLTISTTSTNSNSQALISYPSSPLTYAQARIADHTQREEMLAQIHLANWAGSLQRSLQNERARYKALSHNQRMAWLRERLDDCRTDQSAMSTGLLTALPASPDTQNRSPNEKPRRFPSQCGLANAADPLGLMRLDEALKRRGWVAFQVIGSFGVLGAVALWVARNWSNMGMSFDGSGSWTWGWSGVVE